MGIQCDKNNICYNFCKAESDSENEAKLIQFVYCDEDAPSPEGNDLINLSPDFLILDEEKEKLLKNKIGLINFKDLFMDSLSNEFLSLLKKNEKFFYAKNFLEGICKEYGLLGRSKNINEAYKIYKEGADFKYDYMCMYRLHRIYLNDYEKFKIKRNFELDRLYLYKCFAFIPYQIINQEYNILNRIDITNELRIYFNYLDESKFNNFSQFINYIRNNLNLFNIKYNDTLLMEAVIYNEFDINVKSNYNNYLNLFLKINKENNNDMAYYESQLKYCNFYYEFAGNNCNKKIVNDIFDKLINSEYYKACYDYGKFLVGEEKLDEAKNMFKLGKDKSQQFCLGEYLYLVLKTYDLNQLLSDYKITSYFLNDLCLNISLEKLNIVSFYYTIYYLTKHSSFKDKIKNAYHKYALEIYKNKKKLLEIENAEFLTKNFSKKYQIENHLGFGRMCYYGIPDLIESNKEMALNIFKKGYKLAKENDYIFLKRINYLYMYKSRKFLFKNNKITLRKLNKTKEKLFRLYEETEENNLSIIELYNYYKLYKFGVIGNTLQKMLIFLKKGKKEKLIFNFIEFVYKEKCRIALEKEYSMFNLNHYNVILKNEFLNKDNINLIFKTTEGTNDYKLSVPKNLQFIKVVHILFNTYPELETKKIGTYICNANKINLFDTVSENNLQNNSIILIYIKIDSINNNNIKNDNIKEDINTKNNSNINFNINMPQNEEINYNENFNEEEEQNNNEGYNENQNNYFKIIDEIEGNQNINNDYAEQDEQEENNYEENNDIEEEVEENDNENDNEEINNQNINYNMENYEEQNNNENYSNIFEYVDNQYNNEYNDENNNEEFEENQNNNEDNYNANEEY